MMGSTQQVLKITVEDRYCSSGIELIRLVRPADEIHVVVTLRFKDQTYVSELELGHGV